MWKQQIPIFPQYFPFYSQQWPIYAPPYPLPSLNIDETDIKVMTQQTTVSSDTPPLMPTQKVSKILRPIKVTKEKRSRPIRKRRGEDNFDKKRQKKDRNLPSNICRLFTTLLCQHTSPMAILGVQNSKHQEILQSCIHQVKEHISETQTYVRPSIIEQMCKGELLGRSESQIFRTFFKRFIQVELKMMVSMMRKLRKKQKQAYFKLGSKFLKKFISKR